MNENIFEEKKLVKSKKYPRGIVITVVLGTISLLFTIISLFLILITVNEYYYNNGVTMIALLFSILIFSLLGLICAVIGFLKARIIHKSGKYATTGSVLNSFGILLNIIEIITAIIIILNYSI